MFAQVITARALDPVRVKKVAEDWATDLMPGATGFLGSTGGVTEDGRFIAVVRFDSVSSASANSRRDEQGAWWGLISATLEDVVFVDSSDVEVVNGGGSDDAGFVQVIRGIAEDPSALRAAEAALLGSLMKHRPDYIGAVRVWEPDGRFTEVVYFTSEAAAREGERKQLPADAAAAFDNLRAQMRDVEYLDLTDPWLTSPE